MARTNRALLPGIDTVLLAPPPEYAHISASLVRQIGPDPIPALKELKYRAAA